MKTIIAVLFCSGLVFGQTLTLTGPATARPGNTIAVDVVLASPPADLAGVQWSVGLPPGLTATATAGAASNTAAKTLYCKDDATLCLAVGINTNLYAAGVVATYSVVLPAVLTPGPVTIPLSGVIGATLEGKQAPLTAGAAYSFNVLSSMDLNGDGTVDVQDLQLMIQEILSGALAHDQNGDGAADVRDAQIVARAATQG